MIRGICPKHQERIETFQPYKRGNLGRRNPFFLLKELNDTDKHRLVPVLAVVIGGYQFSGLIGGGSKFYRGASLHPNAKVGFVRPLPEGGVPVVDSIDLEAGKLKVRMETQVQVNFRVTPEIRFGHGCDAVERLPVIPTLLRMANEVSRVVESFSGEF